MRRKNVIRKKEKMGMSKKLVKHSMENEKKLK
jgi:hypothetical protein